jgi:hypothetical protein
MTNTSREETPSMQWPEGWLSPGAGLDAQANRKTHCPLPGIEPSPPVHSQTLLTKLLQLFLVMVLQDKQAGHQDLITRTGKCESRSLPLTTTMKCTQQLAE